MALPINFSNKTYGAGFLGIDDGGASASFQVDAASTYTVTVNGTINRVGDTVTLTYGNDAPTGFAGRSVELTATQYDNSNMILLTSTSLPPGETEAGSYRYVLSNTQLFGRNPPPPATRTRFTADDDNIGSYSSQTTPCYTTGTLIRTIRGEVAVEDLIVGDLIVTGSGNLRPIRWIGHRTVSCHGRNDVLPVRIAKGAFGPGRPVRDLTVSPAHALCLTAEGAEVLIPAVRLINGTTVAQIEVETVTYWHVELDSHDILLAEGLPAESYLDCGNRRFFANAEITDLMAAPDARPEGTLPFCRPFHDAGPVVEMVRAQLQKRAVALGWRKVEEAFAALHLVADGRTIRPDVQGLTARFVVPAEARDVRLVSETSVPAHVVSGSTDDRRLGVALAALTIDDGLTGARAVAIDDARLGKGFHATDDGARWTDGSAVLPAALWDGCKGSFCLQVTLACSALARWVASDEATSVAEYADVRARA